MEYQIRDFLCMIIHKVTGKLRCPYCWKDMTIRAGAVFICSRDKCPLWRIGFE